MTRRPAHSLVELVVAVTLLGSSVAAVSAAATLAARSTRTAIDRQRAVAFAASVLDSLVATDSPATGATASADLHAAWTVRGTGATYAEIRVVVRSQADARLLATLDGGWVRPPAILPAP